MKKKLLIVLASVLGVLLLLFGGFYIYASNFYHASRETAMVLRAAEEDNGKLVFGSKNSTKGFIFYPGGKVEYTAYAPLMEELSKKGFLCVLVKMPYNLAVFNVNAADGIRAEYPQIKDWYIGGHSLGGAMAASYVNGHNGEFKGLVLLAAYSAKDIKTSGTRVVTIYGSCDGVLNKEKLKENAKNLPQGSKTVIIPGGCHSYFGDYGMQEGDGTPKITQNEQIEETVKTINDFSED